MKQHLSAIVRNRSASADADGPDHIRPGGRPARDWRATCASALPWALLAGFLILASLLLGDRILPARPLAIETVVTVRESPDSGPAPSPSSAPPPGNPGALASIPAGASMLFQASGWIEPDPYPVMATALAGGVVESVHVLEGETVTKGQLLATLIDDDARLDLETARSRLDSLEAQAAAHRMLIDVAQAEIASLEKQVAAALARRNESADLAARLERAGAQAVPEKDVARARLEHLTRDAEVEALAVTRAELRARLGQLRETTTDFEARIAGAVTEVARRQLALDRTRITSPIDGRVLRLLAMPGQKKMLANDNPESAVVAILYDPVRLQARIDVPLAEAARLFPGQAVRLRSEILPDAVFAGQVTRIAGEADLQRNTLQVKAAIDNPDGRLRPEMLCRAEFLALARTTPSTADRNGEVATATATTGGDRIRVYVPVAALIPGTGTGRAAESEVWKVDPTGRRVSRQAIRLGDGIREAHRPVLEGLRPGDRVVLDPPSGLEEGDRFRLSSPEAASRS